MAASIFNGDAVKILKDKLRMKGGLEILSIQADPEVTSIDAPVNSFGTFGGKLYVKQDAGDTVNWTPQATIADVAGHSLNDAYLAGVPKIYPTAGLGPVHIKNGEGANDVNSNLRITDFDESENYLFAGKSGLLANKYLFTQAGISGAAINVTPNENIEVTDADGTELIRNESDVLYIEDFKENDNTYFTNDGFGTVTATDDTVTPIGGVRSVKIATSAASAGEKTVSPSITVTSLMKEFGTIGFNCNTRFDGTKGDMILRVEFNNGTDWTTLSSITFDFSAGDKLNRFLMNIPSTATLFRYSIEVVTFGDYILDIGMIKLVSNPLPTAEYVEVNSISLSGNDGRAITADTEDIHFNGTGIGWVSSGDDHYYEVQNNGSIVSIVGSTMVTAVGGNSNSLYVNGVIHKRIGVYIADDTSFTFNYTSRLGEFNSGDKLSIRFINNTRTLNNNQEYHYLNIVESKASTKTIFEGAVDSRDTATETIIVESTGTFPTKGTPLIDRVLFRNTGDSYLFNYSYSQDAVGSLGTGDYLYKLPNELSFNASLVTYHTASTSPVSTLGGKGYITNTSSIATNQSMVSVVPYDSTHFRLLVQNVSSTTLDDIATYNGASIMGYNDLHRMSVEFNAPISGIQASQHDLLYAVSDKFAAVSDGSAATDSTRYFHNFELDTTATEYFTTSAGTSTFETTNPLEKTKSINWVATAGDTLEVALAVDSPEYRMNAIAIKALANSTADDDFTIAAQLWNGVTWSTVNSSNIKATTKLFKLMANIADDVTSIKLLVTCVADSTLIIDKVSLDLEPLLTAEMVQENSIGLESNDGRTITVNTEDIQFNGSGIGWVSVGDSHTYEVQNDNTIIKINTSVMFTTITTKALFIYVDGVEYKTISSLLDENIHVGTYISKAGEFSKGVKLSIRVSTNAGTLNPVINRHYLNIIESASSQNVVFEGASSDMDWTAYTPTFTGMGATTNEAATHRRVGDSLEVNAIVTTGTMAASLASITLPSGLSLDTTKLTESNTTAVEGNRVGEYTSSSVGGIQHGEIVSATGTSSSVLYFASSQSNSANHLIPANGDVLTGNTTKLAIKFTVPIQGWKASDVIYSVPVTNLVENVYSARIANNGTATITSESSSFIESATRSATGKITIVYKTGFFSATPSVVAIQEDNNSTTSIVSESETGCIVFVEDVSGTDADRDVAIMIQRQGTDYIAPKGYFLGNLSQPVGYLKDVKPSGTAGGTFTQSIWQTRDLNTIEGDFGLFGTLSANEFTLEAGTYEIEASAPCRGTANNHKAKLRNTTDGTDVIIGQNTRTGGADDYTCSIAVGSFSISSSKTFELQHYCQTTRSTDGFGVAASFIVDEIYSIVKIRKLR